MKKLLSLIFLLIAALSLCQEKYTIKDFSKDYFLEVHRSKSDEGGFELLLYDKIKKNILVRTNADLLEQEFEDLRSNVVELPYGDQSIVIFDDFNFDGKNDLALKTGNYSCYGGPSYNVYLFQKEKFILNKEFSDLAQENCGFFDVDVEKKQIHSMTKSGCCWHKSSDYSIKNGKLFLIKSTEESYDGNTVTNLIKEWKNGKYITRKETQLPAADIHKDNILLHYEILNGKKLFIIKNGDNSISYFFTRGSNKVELMFEGNFFYSKSKNTLSFENNDAVYTIHNNKVVVNTGGKTYVLEAKSNSQTGNLSKIYMLFKENNIENLEILP